MGPPFSALTGMMTATQAPQFRAAKQPDGRGDRVGWRRDQMGFQERCRLVAVTVAVLAGTLPCQARGEDVP